MRIFAALVSVLMISACGSNDDIHHDFYEDEEEFSTLEEKGGETYEEFDERRDELEGSLGDFAGYGCTVDCSGHEAGYNWAAEKGITDPDSCGGNSWSFEEGCRAYAEDNGGY